MPFVGPSLSGKGLGLIVLPGESVEFVPFGDTVLMRYDELQSRRNDYRINYGVHPSETLLSMALYPQLKPPRSVAGSKADLELTMYSDAREEEHIHRLKIRALPTNGRQRVHNRGMTPQEFSTSYSPDSRRIFSGKRRATSAKDLFFAHNPRVARKQLKFCTSCRVVYTRKSFFGGAHLCPVSHRRGSVTEREDTAAPISRRYCTRSSDAAGK